MAKAIVENYGLHLDSSDGLWWLLQQSGGQSAIGLPGTQCPFRIKSPLLMCTHKFDLSLTQAQHEPLLKEYIVALKSSPLLRFFDPVCEQEVRFAYVEIEKAYEYQFMLRLQGLLCPSISLSCPASTVNKPAIEVITRRVNGSTFGNYFIYDVKPDMFNIINNMAMTTLSLRGRIIMAGPRVPIFNGNTAIKRLKIDDWAIAFMKDRTNADMNIIGSLRVKEFMRR